MHVLDNNISCYGTTEPTLALRSIKLGPLSLLYSQDSVRRITWHDTELIRGITWPVRDENWGTYPAVIHDEQIEHDNETFRVKLHFSVADKHLDCQLHLTAKANGEVNIAITMTPGEEPFSTNRAGLTVLHPINGTAGMPLTVTHSDGQKAQSKFPRLISFDQPVKNIQGLRYTIDKSQVDIQFEGEIFEMEDQRNWSDASYKTYCVPLEFPYTYSIERPITQSILLSCSGTAAVENASANEALRMQVLDDISPQISLAIEPGWVGDPEIHECIAKAKVSQLLVRVEPDLDHSFLSTCAVLCERLGADPDLEIVLDDEEPVENSLHKIAKTVADHQLQPARVLALRNIYMASHQPSGPWPEGATPTDVCKATRAAFPDAKIGGGMLTNFIELNRCRPDPNLCDYVSHANTAIVHASDDLSVLETLEALPQIFKSTEAMSNGKPYRLGLVSIGMRTNPYGKDIAENPKQVRRTMAREDPRQRGLFAAAWSVGVLAATEISRIEAICLAAPSGPFGVVYAPQHYKQPGFDDNEFENNSTVVFPLYHVVREACRMSGLHRLTFDGLPDGIAAFGVQHKAAGKNQAMLANISAEQREISLSDAAAVVVLDSNSFGDAIRDPDWRDNTQPTAITQIQLSPFAVAFLDWDN